jgi:alpha 1,2-mannosyltransferase
MAILFMSLVVLCSLTAYRKQAQFSTRTLKYSHSNTEPVRACFVILVRNNELDGIVHSMRQLQDTFNGKFEYPYVFLNDQEFTPEFIATTSSIGKANKHYGKLDDQMWGYPSFINQTYAAECREEMARGNIPYADSESYRHMCR